MIAYLDSSAVLRIARREPNAFSIWKSITVAIASTLVEVECLRTIDRHRLMGPASAERAAQMQQIVARILSAFEYVDVTSAILRRAAQPLPVPLGTLDAIHLATASAWRDDRDLDLSIVTHDRALAAAARAMGFRALGDQ